MNQTDKLLKIGDVFTPIKWAEFAIEKFKIFDEWLNGASVFDPTMGEGNLLEALITFGLKKGFTIDQLPTYLLYGNELNQNFYEIAVRKFHEKYNIDISHQLWNQDILALSKKTFDIIFGNPPWQNFVDLPEEYKTKIKQEFLKYGLVEDQRNLLLGGSRIDIAALIIQKVIKDFLKTKGRAFFFLPLSLFLGGGANKYFRKYKIAHIMYSVKKIYDFNELDIFEHVSTRYGLAYFKRDERQGFPIEFERLEKHIWVKYRARPVLDSTAPLSVLKSKEDDPLLNFTPIRIQEESLPRQGVNTCGANSVFFFNSYEEIDSKMCLVSGHKLPKKYIYPLVTSSNFRESELKPSKWVLLPYSKNGRPLKKEELLSEESLFNYLLKYKKVLQNRKGSLIGSWIKKGCWWSLLGVGGYSFFPYMVVWEAYGKNHFKPMLLTGEWQANQSLQAFIPLKILDEAKQILCELQNPVIESYLLSFKMEGTMNWAQPGKIRPLLKFVN